MMGERIENRYRFIELLGRGGMGEVSRVLDTAVGREVALKRLLVSEPSKAAAAVELFEREYHTLSELSHPRIIEVYDYGVTGDGAYYTMELLTGSDLRTMGRVPWTTACALLRDLASSLAIIHSRRLIHCDLSPRNVRCTGDGRAKLLDFGAMVPMGPSRQIAGTPPFVAPETLEGLSLDGRADLFGFGALAYWILTGRNAYPAKELVDLPQRWNMPVRSPRELEPSVPAWLSDLVMECLRIDRSARPRTAGVVMDRICRLASLPLEEHREVAAAYLTTPTLVGRAEQLAKVRQRLAAASGGLVIVEGPGGSGRSRFLDACALEAKLSGRKALRIAAAESGPAPYAAARAIAAQLAALAPAVLSDTREGDRAVLAHVLGTDVAGAPPCVPPPAHEALLRVLADFVVAAGSSAAALIAIDDADRIDGDSMAVLLSIAQRAEPRTPCLVAVIDSGVEGGVAVDALRRHGETVTLSPLTEQQTEELVRSLFGSVTHSLAVAQRLHAVAGGRPKLVLQLAAQLVDRNVVRYEAGSFVLPEWIHDDELPDSLSAALAQRLDSFSADAAELAFVLALTDARELPVASYPELTTHRDRRRTFRAVDELVRTQFLVAEGDRYRVENETWRDVVTEKLTVEEQRTLHARIARQFESTNKVNRRAFHLKRSGDAKAAALVLLAQFIKDPNEPRDPLEDYVPGVLDFLEEIARAADALDIPVPWKVELWMKTLGASQFVGDIARFERLAPPLLERLKRDSGLTDYEELMAEDPSATVFEAFGRVQARFEAAAEHERGLPLPDAMREVARLCVMHSGMAMISLDTSIDRRIPDLMPLGALSPAIATIKQLLAAMRSMVQGRTNSAREAFLRLLAHLEDPERAGLGELYHRSIRLAVLYIVGLTEAAAGMESALERARHLENEPGHRVNAQRIYMIALLMRGDMEGAVAAQRRAELLMLQEARHQRYPGTTARSELQTCCILEDVAGIRELTERLVKATSDYPQWGVYADMARHHHARLQGDFAGALAALEPALRATAPLDHREWPAVAAAHVQALSDLGRTEEALRLGREYLETCSSLGLHPGAAQVSQSIAGALLAAGRHRDAATIVDELIDESLRVESRGLPLGVLYDLRARVAVADRDEPAFQKFFALCRDEYQADRVPALGAMVQRLLREAQRTNFRSSYAPELADVEAGLLTVTAGSLVEARLFTGNDPTVRLESVLEALVQSLEPKPDAAFLFVASDGGARFLCALPTGEPSEDVRMAAEAFFGSQTEFDECHTRTAFMGADQSERGAGKLPSLVPSTRVHSIPLPCTRRGEGQIAGVAIVRAAKSPTPARAHVLELLGAALLEAEEMLQAEANDVKSA